ncbi:MAG TPA: hypothetical protein VEJ44_07260, partial [Acidimicrobiales bacterium]|nr:hypothetical protein [Acidimicrobiales bacterium]
MSARTLPSEALGSDVAVLQPSKASLLSVPLELAPARPGWLWLAASDGLVALLVILVASNLLPMLAPARASIGTNLEFVGISWAALAAAAVMKRVYPKARRHIVPAPADELATVESAIIIGALATLALAALVPTLLRGPL